MNKLIALSTLIASISLCTPALAWNKAGHMVSGAIAYTELKKIAPQSLPRVINLLKKHPYYQTKWQSEIAQKSPSDPDLYLFMAAARWADDARKTTEDRPAWHYVNLPFKLGSTPTTTPSAPVGEDNIRSP
jgi:hypothetical protein